MAFSPETYALIMGKGGAANGLATLNGSGKIPESQLPSSTRTSAARLAGNKIIGGKNV